MKKITSLVLVILTLALALCMQSCGLLKTFLDGRDLADFYYVRSNLYYASDIKMTSEASQIITLDSLGQSLSGTATANISAVCMNMGEEDMIYDRTVISTVSSNMSGKLVEEERTESESYCDGKAYFSGLGQKRYKSIYGEMSPDRYMGYLEISAYSQEELALNLDEWASKINVYDRDNKGSIRFEYTGISEECIGEFESWVSAMTQVAAKDVSIVECSLIRIYDEKKNVQTEEQLRIKVNFKLNIFDCVTMEYSESRTYSDPTDADIFSTDKYDGAVEVGDFVEVSSLLAYVSFLAFPSKEYNESYSFDYYNKTEIDTPSGSSQTEEVSESVKVGYDLEKDDKYHYESVDKKSGIRYEYHSPFLGAYQDDTRLSLDEIEESDMKLGMEMKLSSFEIQLADVTGITVTDLEDGGQRIKITFDGHANYVAILGLHSSSDASGYVLIDYDSELHMEAITVHTVVFGKINSSSVTVVTDSKLDNFGVADFD